MDCNLTIKFSNAIYDPTGQQPNVSLSTWLNVYCSCLALFFLYSESCAMESHAGNDMIESLLQRQESPSPNQIITRPIFLLFDVVKYQKDRRFMVVAFFLGLGQWDTLTPFVLMTAKIEFITYIHFSLQ